MSFASRWSYRLGLLKAVVVVAELRDRREGRDGCAGSQSSATEDVCKVTVL